ncbi:MAG TPA: discoidin domain-containing protein [Casimicrobiaceae bacterium]|nr:discoidin domain-containing protein [Casimicrobiaceae bacterium]
MILFFLVRCGGAHRVALAIGLAIVAGALPLSAQASEPSTPRLLDNFDDLSLWHAAASDGVRASLSRAQDENGGALRLDFDLGGTAGYALAWRALPLDLPPNFELSFYLRADAPVNNLQLKLVDASGDNVWWYNRPDFEFPAAWREIRIRKRQIEFAWGPTKDRTLTHAARIEFVIAAGRGGGRGSVYLRGLAVRELPPPPAAWPESVVRASSQLAGGEARLALDGDRATAWRTDPRAGAEQYLTVDFGMPREFGGLILHWMSDAYASRYDVQFSNDSVQWVTMRKVEGSRGGPDALMLPGAETRFLRLALHEGPANCYALAEMEIEDVAFGESPNAFFTALAREAPRGAYPRGFSGEQSYWTLVGIDGGHESGLLSEDGALETARGGFSIEPFVVVDSRVMTWADVDARPFLTEQYLPMPGVIWREARWELTVSAFASGTREQSSLVASYELRNRSEMPLSLQLVLAVRPFQVNPPTQFLNTPGGVSPIREAAWDGSALAIDGRKVFPLRAPNRFGAFGADDGPVPKLIAQPGWNGTTKVKDASGFASAALGYDLVLAPHASATVGVVVPLSGSAASPALHGLTPQHWLAREHRVVAAAWRQKLNRVELHVPAAAQPVADTVRTALAHILVTRDGPMLRPGTRAYARSWIRDGTMMSESLLRLGHEDVAADYLRWYAPYQFANGKVPCCVDERGADPVPENDSGGEFIYLAAEIHRYARDRALAEAMWPRIEASLRYLDSLRHSGRSEHRTAATPAFAGLLPASISHEGYSEKPMHSYWDDFWALKGYDAAVDLASKLGHIDEAGNFARERDEFAADLAASLRSAAAAHGIDYLPGSAELGDFDPASSTIAFAPGGDAKRVPPELIAPTFERYWREFTARRDGGQWDEYTPYELRSVSTLLRLGWSDRARQALAFFLAGRRPAAWNQWAEVVGHDLREPRFLGDMPHGWIASDFIRAALDLFAYEREDDRAMVLASGIPRDWLDGSGIAVRDLRTPYGRLSYSLRKEGDARVLRVTRGSSLPPGGFVLIWRESGSPPAARVNGRDVQWQRGELKISEIPATVVIKKR